MRLVCKYHEMLTADENVFPIAADFRKAFGKTADFGFSGENLWRAWRQCDRPEIHGGGAEPVYFNTLTPSGHSKFFLDDQCANGEFSLKVPSGCVHVVTVENGYNGTFRCE